MTGATSFHAHAWWLASRASGLTALALVTFSVILGLVMSGRLMRRPGLGKTLLAVHEHTALAGLVAIAVHGLTLLGDPWLNPGPVGIAVPGAMSYRPAFVAAGIVGGYLAALLGLSFYVRRHIGARLWRKAHRATIVVYGLSVVHTLGAGSDASTPWLRWWLVITAPIVVVLLALRILGPSLSRGRGRSRDGRMPGAGLEPATRGL